MGFLDSLKSAVFVEDPNAAAPAPAQPASSGARPTLTQPPQVVPTGVNADFVAAIKKAVFSKSTALTSLVQAADSLAEIIPDTTTRYKAAFKTSGAGRTPQQIAQAADIHLADVDGEEMRFKAAVDQKLGSEIVQAESAAATAAQGIQAAQKLIESLQAQLTEAHARIGALSQQQAEQQAVAATKKAELDSTALQFKAAADAVRNEINTLRQTVSNALS